MLFIFFERSQGSFLIVFFFHGFYSAKINYCNKSADTPKKIPTFATVKNIAHKILFIFYHIKIDK